MEVFKRSEGMTLIELLIVLVVVAIISSMSIPRFTNMVNKTKVTAAETELKHAQDGIQYYSTENDSMAYPVTSLITSYTELNSVVAPFIGALPPESTAKFSFVSYTGGDTSFALRVRAKDQDRTLLEANQNGIIHP